MPRLGCSASPSLLELSCISVPEINVPTLLPFYSLPLLLLFNGNIGEKFVRDSPGSRSPFRSQVETRVEKPDSTQQTVHLGEQDATPAQSNEAEVPRLGHVKASCRMG